MPYNNNTNTLSSIGTNQHDVLAKRPYIHCVASIRDALHVVQEAMKYSCFLNFITVTP